MIQRYAIERGLLTINGNHVTVDAILKNGDVIGHKIHRHEPPCTDQPIKIVHEDQDLFVVDKPGGMPVHPAGRYRHNTIVHVLKKERNIPKLYRKSSQVYIICNFLNCLIPPQVYVPLHHNIIYKTYTKVPAFQCELL